MPNENIPALYTRTYTARELAVVARALALTAALLDHCGDDPDELMDLSVRVMPEVWET